MGEVWTGLTIEQIHLKSDRVIVLPDPTPEKIGLIFIPNSAKEAFRNEIGTVMAIGPGYYDRKGKWIPTTVKVGDRVVYDKSVMNTVDIGKNLGDTIQYKMIGELDIKGIMHSKDDTTLRFVSCNKASLVNTTPNFDLQPDRVLLRPIIQPSITPAGIELPFNPKDYYQAEVVAIGPNITDVVPGDKVVVNPNYKIDIDIDGRSFILVRIDNVLAVLE